MKKHIDLIVVISYFALNLINTYFLTSDDLNRYIVPFDYTFTSIISSFIGNLAILTLLFLLGIIIFKKPRRIALYLTIVTGVLNMVVIVLGYYTKSYKIAFSVNNFTIFKNPTGGFGFNVFFDWIYELFGYFRIVSLIPFIFLLIISIKYKNSFQEEPVKLSLIKCLSAFAIIISAQATLYGYCSKQLEKNWKSTSDYAQYGCQYIGVYNYYFSEIILGIDYRTISEDEMTTEECYQDLAEFDKNKNEYINFIDNQSYSINDDQTGILSDCNIFTIQMESTMSFCYEASYKGVEITPYFNELFKEENCFYFDNVYTNVGMGNTSDAEFAYFTGYYPTGDMTIVWEYADYDFTLKSMGDYLSDYTKYSYNPTTEVFYNHNVVHPQWFKMDEFVGLETYLSLYPKEENEEKYLDYWISDESILNWATKRAQSEIAKGNKSFSFVETITPHNPFPDFSNKFDDYEKTDFDLGKLNYQLENYINQVKYNDKKLYEFLKDVTNPNSENYLENTIFILYGDHGNGLPKESYEELFNRKLSDLEYRKISLNIPVIVYDPTGRIYESMNGKDIEAITHMVKSERDLNRTIINLLGKEFDDYVFGVNMFSGEPSYSYDPKNFDIITDNFMYSKKQEDYVIFNDEIDMGIIDSICEYRRKQDLYINTLVYTSKEKSSK